MILGLLVVYHNATVMTRHTTLGGTVPTFQEITGLTVQEYVIISLPQQIHIDDERRDRAVARATARYIQLVKDGLPIGYRFDDGENITTENDDDLCPIGYPSKNGRIDLGEIIDKLNFSVVLNLYRKIL